MPLCGCRGVTVRDRDKVDVGMGSCSRPQAKESLLGKRASAMSEERDDRSLGRFLKDGVFRGRRRWIARLGWRREVGDRVDAEPRSEFRAEHRGHCLWW